MGSFLVVGVFLLRLYFCLSMACEHFDLLSQCASRRIARGSASLLPARAKDTVQVLLSSGTLAVDKRTNGRKV